MSDTDTEFARWLRQKAAEAGYDTAVRGNISALAKAAGTDVGQTSRALHGKAVPSPETLRSLAQALRVTLVEMYLQAGILRPEDVANVFKPDENVDWSMYTAAESDPQAELRARGRSLGVPEAGLDLYVSLMTRVERSVADELRNRSDG